MTAAGTPRYRLGIDIQSIGAVAASLEEFAERYTERLFTAAELAWAAEAPGVAARRLALCFAAKEAALKALDVQDDAPPMRTVELAHLGDRAVIRLTGPAAELAATRSVTRLHTSLTHTRLIAAAVVLAETGR